MSHRNEVRQVIILKDGSSKIIWHKKLSNMPRQYHGVRPIKRRKAATA